MNVERNKAIVERYYGELNRGNLSIVDELIDEDYIAHDPSLPEDRREGIDNLKRTIELALATIHDRRIELDDVIGEGDLVACRLKVYGHLAGEWDDFDGDGREISFTGMGMFRIEDGVIAEAWFNFDQHGFLRQLGALPPGTLDPDSTSRL